MRTPVLGISGPADQPAVQGIPAGFCFRDDAAVSRCPNANAMMTQTARSRTRKARSKNLRFKIWIKLLFHRILTCKRRADCDWEAQGMSRSFSFVRLRRHG